MRFGLAGLRPSDGKRQAKSCPGLEPENISIDIGVNQITIKDEECGPRPHSANLIVNEWSIGPYYRQVPLHQNIRASLTNATYGNGVLVIDAEMAGRQRGSKSQLYLQPNRCYSECTPMANIRRAARRRAASFVTFDIAYARRTDWSPRQMI